MQTAVYNNKIKIVYAKGINWREQILLNIFAAIGPLHHHLYVHRPKWHITTAQLLQYQPQSLGHSIGLFLQADGLEPIPRAERHDVFHVLLNYNSSVQQEAAMQFCILGAGKKSPSVLATVFLALVFLPEYWPYFASQYTRGKVFNNFYELPFQHMLHYNLNKLQCSIFKKSFNPTS